jgi:uroporphyrinogen decarboxylase
MIFDTWGGILAHDDYEPFSLAYVRPIVKSLRVPTILFTKGGSPWLREMLSSGVSALGLDWTTDARHARALAAGRVALQGNLDPAALFAPEKSVRAAARAVLDAFGCEPGHIFNLGHGIAPTTPIEAVAALVDEVRAYSRARAKNNNAA